MTLSGGEPGLQPRFAGAFLKALKEQGIQTALDTCGLCSQNALELMLPYTSLVLFDMKVMDPSGHERFTGSDNKRVLSNLKYTAEFIRTHVHPKFIWIRTPIIPGATDSEENIRATGAWIAENISFAVERWELCAFNNLCQDKYQRLDLIWDFEDAELMRQVDMERFAEVARRSGVDPEIVHWSGSTRLEETGESEVDDCRVLRVPNNACSAP